MPIRRREGALRKTAFKGKEWMRKGSLPAAAAGKRGREALGNEGLAGDSGQGIFCEGVGAGECRSEACKGG